MPVDAETLKALIESELRMLTDERVLGHIRALLVEPKAEFRAWDYGNPGQEHLCWGVLEDFSSDTGIAYCEQGFGPGRPWGLLSLGSGRSTSMGMDSGWFETFLDAVFDSFVVTVLPIWRVFKTGTGASRQAISDESDWNETWRQVKALREADPGNRYDCGTSIVWRSE